MKLIPQSIKNLFNKLFSRKAKTPVIEAAVEAPVAEVAAVPAAVAPVVQPAPAPKPEDTSAPWAGRRSRVIAGSKSKEGVYTFDLNIAPPTATPLGQMVMMTNSYAADFHLMLMGNAPLAGVKALGTAIEKHLKANFDVDTAKVFFKMKNENFYIDGKDDFVGLPMGGTYQIVVVPQGVKWKPPVYVPPARKAQGESCPILTLPVLPPYLYQKLNGTAPPPQKKGAFAPK